LSFFSVLLLRPRLSTPFPYTTLFRSPQPVAEHGVVLAVEERIGTGQRQLGLVADQWQRGVLLQPSPLIRHKIRHANMADLSVRRSEEHTSELQSRENLVCRLLLEKKK